MASNKEIIGEPLVIGGRTLSLSRAVRAGDMIYLTGQIPMQDGAPMTDGSIEDQTRSCIENIRATLQLTGCDLDNIVKTTVWLKDRADFPGFDKTYGEYFSDAPPARTGLVGEFLVDIKVEIECIAYAG
ncbi:MAG: RidA family protein [Woeseia sp.]|jgi:2-iminobutanoate/2-iminopropanoate deaminase|nr:RidA family protein [Woeseia sp.]MBT6211390.1 RidA family protein [Woeseia sp.]